MNVGLEFHPFGVILMGLLNKHVTDKLTEHIYMDGQTLEVPELILHIRWKLYTLNHVIFFWQESHKET